MNRGFAVRCLITHKWVTGRAFHVTSRVPYVRHVLPYRKCERCGMMQRGAHDAYSGGIAWETMRERAYIKSDQVRIVRRPASRLQRLAHALGLRRTRREDTGKSPGLGLRRRGNRDDGGTIGRDTAEA